MKLGVMIMLMEIRRILELLNSSKIFKVDTWYCDELESPDSEC